MDYFLILYKKGSDILKKITKVVGYCRVSTEEQKKYGYSINAQIDKIKNENG